MTEETFLFLDTETTKFRKSGALVQPEQARVCQLAMLLTDGNGKSLAEFCGLITPDNWTISENAFKVHGFTDDLCRKFGIKKETAVGMFVNFAKKADVIVAHNAEFDRGMMDIEFAYIAEVLNKTVPPSPFKWFCTMKDDYIRKTVNALDKNGQLKDPKLEEALEHFCNRNLGDNAHDAMYDVKALRDIFFASRLRRAA